MPNHVDVEAIRKAATMMGADDGPIAFLRNVQTLLEDVPLDSMSLTLLGVGVVGRHNASVDGHLANIKGGIEHLKTASEKLGQAADNWERSDQPWVVK